MTTDLEKFAEAQNQAHQVSQEVALKLADFLAQGITYSGLIGVVQAFTERFGSPIEIAVSHLVSDLFDQWDKLPEGATNMSVVLNYDLTKVPGDNEPEVEDFEDHLNHDTSMNG